MATVKRKAGSFHFVLALHTSQGWVRERDAMHRLKLRSCDTSSCFCTGGVNGFEVPLFPIAELSALGVGKGHLCAQLRTYSSENEAAAGFLNFALKGAAEGFLPLTASLQLVNEAVKPAMLGLHPGHLVQQQIFMEQLQAAILNGQTMQMLFLLLIVSTERFPNNKPEVPDAILETLP